MRKKIRWLLVFKDHVLNRRLRESVVKGVVEKTIVVQVRDGRDKILCEFEGDLFNRRYVVGKLHLWKL